MKLGSIDQSCRFKLVPRLVPHRALSISFGINADNKKEAVSKVIFAVTLSLSKCDFD